MCALGVGFSTIFREEFQKLKVLKRKKQSRFLEHFETWIVILNNNFCQYRLDKFWIVPADSLFNFVERPQAMRNGTLVEVEPLGGSESCWKGGNKETLFGSSRSRVVDEC